MQHGCGSDRASGPPPALPGAWHRLRPMGGAGEGVWAMLSLSRASPGQVAPCTITATPLHAEEQLDWAPTTGTGGDRCLASLRLPASPQHTL